MLRMGTLTAAERQNSRIEVLRELARGFLGSRQSGEALFPLRPDTASILPLASTLTRLSLSPRSAGKLSAGTVAAYSLRPGSAREVAAAWKRTKTAERSHFSAALSLACQLGLPTEVKMKSG
jgi:hypothetical protein